MPKPLLQPTPMTPLRQRTLQIAKQHLGYHETAGSNRGPKGSWLWRVQMGIGQWMLGQPWCAAAATWFIHEAAKYHGIKTEVAKSASSSAIYAEAEREGRVLAKPEAGCLILVRNQGRAGHNRPFEHVGLVHTVRGFELITVEGNWRSGVVWNKRNTRSLNRRDGKPLYAYVRIA